MLKGGCCLVGSRGALYTGRKTAVPTASLLPREGNPKQTPHNAVMGLQGNLSSSTVNARATPTQRLTGVLCYLFEQSAPIDKGRTSCGLSRDALVSKTNGMRLNGDLRHI